ncbi:alpha/beta hydrolase-fold protein [Actinoplanes sp. NPDC051346]|uniref:alpha/beta hydrolase n=1 Tax=Actinoplanes sp. NPDC051346 TaxID=3155048 RepID=UPI003428AD69
MEPAAGSWCTATEIGFRLRDHEHRLVGVRLESSVASGDFHYRDDLRAWELRLPRPDVHRLEYRLTLELGGHSETVADPDNPRRQGDASVLWCPDYREPGWLHLPRCAGRWHDVYLPLPAVHGEMVARVWSPDVATDRVVVAHDGPDYDRYGELGRYTAAMIGAGGLPPYHLVLLPPGERLEWYSASPAYARALAGDVLPKIAAELGTTRPVVGVGASLGGLAMLHAQRRHPTGFAGLFLQSASFFRPRHDRQESGFRRYLRIVRFTGRVVRADDGPGVPVALTCGTVEENLANNKDMARALRDHGYAVTFAEVPDAHNWTAWRDALDPHLTALLRKVFN